MPEGARAGTGRVLAATTIVSSGQAIDFANNALRSMTIGIDNVADQYVLAYMPLTNNQSVGATINLAEY